MTKIPRREQGDFVIEGMPEIPQRMNACFDIRTSTRLYMRLETGRRGYMLDRGEGYGYRKKSNSDYCTNAVVMFLEEYLLRR